MSFSATAPIAGPAAPQDTRVVENDGFFPDIDMMKLRAAMRLDGTVTQERLLDATLTAIISINTELATWKGGAIASGIPSLENDEPRVGGQAVRKIQYLAAVHRTVKADLTERYRDYDSTKSGANDAEERGTTIDDDRRAARWAVRDFLGLPRSTIELI